MAAEAAVTRLTLGQSATSAMTTTTMSRRLRCPPPAAATSASPVTVSLADLPHKRSSATATTNSPVVVEKTDAATLASAWREVQGGGDWTGMVNPLHPLLRDELVRYGELVAACYRAFDLDPSSKRYLNCKLGKNHILPPTAGAGYTVTKYIYAAPDICVNAKSRWIGYVAVTSSADAVRRLGRRDILVSFRGTVTRSEWAANFMSALSPARFDPSDPRSDVRVESGFLSLYTSDDVKYSKFTCGSCRNQLLSEVTRLVSEYSRGGDDVSVTLAGHSMGSSLAMLLGYDLAELGLNRDAAGRAVPVTVFSFAGPRVGNVEFRRRCDELGVKVLRVANARDPVTRMPGVVLNEDTAARVCGRAATWWSKAWCYAHVGVEVALDFFVASDVACVHDIDAYIDHLLSIKCDPATSREDEADADDVASIKVTREGEDGGAAVAAEEVESWRWQMLAIRAGELLQALGI
uniref:Fungal lipase-type domain-containing protein n=1 Tax=Leersia perrieri TaxID=77586 RepID=A0A0D9XRF0_9ORYZ